MVPYTIHPHTADIRLEVRGDSLRELFLAALAGMNEIIQPGFCQSATDFPLAEEISETSPDITALLIDFLSEINTLSHVHNALFCICDFGELNETSLAATLRGVALDGFAEDIKAVTYHEAEVVRDEQGVYSSMIVFDI